MPYLSIRGVDHYYEWISTAENPPSGHKPVMVFLHGWAGSARYWETTARALVDHFDCLLYDLRGFGRSLLPKPVPSEVAAIGYELETYADDLALLADALGIQTFSLNAHSTGASIATFFLNRHAARVDRAILTCSGIFEYDKKTFEAFYKFGKYVVEFRPPWLLKIPLADRMFMSRFLSRPISGEARRAFLEDYIMADYDAALGTIYTAVSKKAVDVMPQEFAQLAMPTLLISGQYDKIIPVDMGDRASTLSHHIQHVVMANTGHFPMLEDVPTYLNHLRTFLSLPSPSSR